MYKIDDFPKPFQTFIPEVLDTTQAMFARMVLPREKVWSNPDIKKIHDIRIRTSPTKPLHTWSTQLKGQTTSVMYFFDT